jgi:hypothetical protein
LKKALVLIGWRFPFSRAICTQSRVDTLWDRKINRTQFITSSKDSENFRYVHDKNPCGHRCIPITVGDPETRYWFNIKVFGTHRSQPVLGISGCIVTRQDFRREQIFECWTPYRNYDRSSMPIRNPSLCENNDYFEHKIYQQRFTSHVLGAPSRKTISLRDWDLGALFSMVYRK